jgi:hypothetical protein
MSVGGGTGTGPATAPASNVGQANATVAGLLFGLIERNLAGQIVNVCGKGVIRLDEIARLAGKPICVQPDSPKVRYEVSIEKLEAMQAVPRTQDTLAAFVRQETGSARGES